MAGTGAETEEIDIDSPAQYNSNNTVQKKKDRKKIGFEDAGAC